MKGRSNVLPTKWEFDVQLEDWKGLDSAAKAILNEAADCFRSKLGSETNYGRIMRTANGWLRMGLLSL
jgi:hypothetical protein